MDAQDPQQSVFAVMRARLTRRVSREDAETLALMADLVPGWRKAFARISDGNDKEDTGARLDG